MIGGGLTAAFGWRSVLLVNVPVAAVLIALAWNSVEESRDETVPRTIDWTGLALVVLSIAAFTYGVDRASDWGWTSPRTLGLMVGGLAGIAVFVMVERRVRVPLMDLGLFRIREFDVITFAGTIGNMATASLIFTSMILLQSVDGLSAGEAGLSFLGFSLGVAASSQISGRVERFPSWLVMSSALVCGGVGAVAMGLAGRLTPFVVVAIVAGFGLGLVWAFTSVATQAVVRPEQAGEASGVVLTVVVTLGGVAIAIASSIIESSSGGTSGLESTLEGILVGAGVLALAAAAVVAFLGRRAAVAVAVAPGGR